MTACVVPLTTTARYTQVNGKWIRDRTKPCGKEAKGTLQDGTPACGVHLNAEKVRIRNAEQRDRRAEILSRSLSMNIRLSGGQAVVSLTELECLAHDRDMLLSALWQCYTHSGADTDGDVGPGALIAGMGIEGYAKVVVQSVNDLKECYDEALEDG